MCRKSIFKLLVLVAMFSMFMVSAAPFASAEDLNAKIASGQYVQKTDAFEVLFDASETMNDAYVGSNKLNQEKALVTLFNQTIPDLKLAAAARAFGQFTTFGGATSKVLFAPAPYSKSALPQAIAPFTKGKGFSPLDAALDGATADLQSQSGQLAVIAFSDGQDMEKFQPVAAAQRMKKAYGDRVCIYTVLLGNKTAAVDVGNKAEGINIMQRIADAGTCGFMVTGDSISTPAAMADFVEKVFLDRDSDGDGVADGRDRCPDTPKGCAVDKDGCPLDTDGDGVIDCRDNCPGTPEGVKVDSKGCPIAVEQRRAAAAPAAKPVVRPIIEPKAEEPAIMTLNILFATGKADIQPKYKGEVQKVADYMKEHTDVQAIIAGHTDNAGKAAANLKLSQNRANNVKNYLVKNFGIDASRLEAVGYGEEKPIAGNATKEGKQKNRRVTATFSKIAR